MIFCTPVFTRFTETLGGRSDFKLCHFNRIRTDSPPSKWSLARKTHNHRLSRHTPGHSSRDLRWSFQPWDKHDIFPGACPLASFFTSLKTSFIRKMIDTSDRNMSRVRHRDSMSIEHSSHQNTRKRMHHRCPTAGGLYPKILPKNQFEPNISHYRVSSLAHEDALHFCTLSIRFFNSTIRSSRSTMEVHLNARCP